MNPTRICLDTNVWIFGLGYSNENCEKILDSLGKFKVSIPNQLRQELESNLWPEARTEFYHLVRIHSIELNYQHVSSTLIDLFKQKGLKKGDAIIAAFCEWKQVEIVISDNRDFLWGLAPGHFFRVMSPKEFCDEFQLL